MLEVDELKAGYGRQDVLHGLSLPRWPPANSPRCWDRTAAASPRCSRRWRASSACAPGRRGWMAATLRQPIRPNARATSSTCRKACPPKSICGCSNPCWWPPAPATGWRPLPAPPRSRRCWNAWASPLALHYLDALSGGQKQLVGLAQALIRRPRVLLLDEPLSALDLNYQFHVMQLLRQETRQYGLISVIVLHDLNAALQHADRAVLIHQGRLAGPARPRM